MGGWEWVAQVCLILWGRCELSLAPTIGTQSCTGRVFPKSHLGQTNPGPLS